MTPELRKVLTDWLEWAEADAPECADFDPTFGLCTNILESRTFEVYCEFKDMLALDFGENSYPFDNGEEEYCMVADDGEHHRNPKRLAWVRRVLEQSDA